ncbi:MAG: M61 family metallopeptidase [Gemmatimonadetes bacterium]|nr:M61 family metallopeptidase [Gemmatimonadota bacterium]
MPASRLFHVKAEFLTAGKDTLFVSLPAWSPGAYEIQNYARYVRHFGARNPAGRPLFWDRVDKDTWRVSTGGATSVVVEFDYLADAVDLSLASLRSDFGQFLGTNLFLFEEGQLDRPAEVRFALPSGWRVATALRPGAAGSYTAPDYHELADAMTFVGQFSLDSLQVDAKWIRIAVWPAAAYTAPVARSLRSSVERIAGVQNRLMGGPPYDTYTLFFNVYRQPIPFAGGLEHGASQFDIMPAHGFADEAGNLGSFMTPLMAHESFHLWNVKRIRPAELWPYDYHAEQFTPLLWWSEGVTDYYADLTNLRAGLWTDGEFIGNLDANVRQVESAPEPWSVEDGSVATWIDEVFVNSSQLYYSKGSVLGLLLDISIRDATDNAKSLDDVMRALYARYYRQAKGFRTADLLGLLREAGMPDVDGFYQRYINGRDPLPYEQVLPKAGLAVERRTTSNVFLGVSMAVDPEGHIVVQEVVPGSSADAVGLQPGDVLLKVGEVEVSGSTGWVAEFRARYRNRVGAPLAITARREGQTLTLNGKVREQIVTQISVSRAASATPKQARIWRGIASGTTGN